MSSLCVLLTPQDNVITPELSSEILDDEDESPKDSPLKVTFQIIELFLGLIVITIFYIWSVFQFSLVNLVMYYKLF